MRVSSAADVQAAEAFRTDFHLFDAYWHGVHGGTGKSFDWDLVAGRRSKVPMVLAGGLTPENVAASDRARPPLCGRRRHGRRGRARPQGPRQGRGIFPSRGAYGAQPVRVLTRHPAGKAEEVAG